MKKNESDAKNILNRLGKLSGFLNNLDPENLRMDLRENRKLRLFLDSRDKRYINEVNAFLNKNVSCINIPGMGCDVIGFVFFPQECGGAYLFSGDFFGKESSVKDFEVSTVEIMCNFLSTLFLKTQFKQQAEYDGLTGLYNSRKIKEELGRVLKRLERKPSLSASIALGDIDFFKKINNTYGHIQGENRLSDDQILTEHIARADTALYTSKENGRNQTTLL